MALTDKQEHLTPGNHSLQTRDIFGGASARDNSQQAILTGCPKFVVGK